MRDCLVFGYFGLWPMTSVIKVTPLSNSLNENRQLLKSLSIKLILGHDAAFKSGDTLIILRSYNRFNEVAA